MNADRFPGIKKAALEIAYDNGGINRMRTQATMLKELCRFLEARPSEILPPIDAWLSALSPENLTTVCVGEYYEAQAILASSPPFTDQLLNDYFEGPC